MAHQPDSAQIRQAMLQLAEQRGSDKSLCPSEVARQLQQDHWRGLMPAVREVAFSLMDEGLVRITQQGRAVCSADVRGPIRISLP